MARESYEQQIIIGILTIPTAARMLRTGQTQIRSLVDSGSIPTFCHPSSFEKPTKKIRANLLYNYCVAQSIPFTQDLLSARNNFIRNFGDSIPGSDSAQIPDLCVTVTHHLSVEEQLQQQEATGDLDEASQQFASQQSATQQSATFFPKAPPKKSRIQKYQSNTGVASNGPLPGAFDLFTPLNPVDPKRRDTATPATHTAINPTADHEEELSDEVMIEETQLKEF